MKLPLAIAAATLMLVSPLSGQQDAQQDQTPRLERIPAWGVRIPSSGRWVGVATIPRACMIFTGTGNGRYKRIYGIIPWTQDFVEPKKGFKIGDIQRLSDGNNMIVKIMPHHYLPSDLKAEEQLCLEENHPQPPEDK